MRNQHVQRVVPKDDPKLLRCFKDLMEKLNWPEVIEDLQGTYRFRTNALFCWMTDPTRGSNHDRSSITYDPPRPHRVSLNDMADGFARGEFTLEEYMNFYMGIGYSLDGFVEVFGEHLGL